MKEHTKKYVFVLVWALALPAFLLAQISFWSLGVYAQDDSSTKDEEIKDSISDLEKKLKKEQAEKAKLEQNLGQIQSSVYSTQKQINQTKSAINETGETISRKEAEISQISDRIVFQKEVLKSVLQQMYYAKQQPMLGVVIAKKDFSEAFGTVDSLITLEEKVRDVSDEIYQAKEKIENEKEELAKLKEEHEDVLEEKQDKQQDLLAVKADVAADVADQQKVIDKLNKELDELRGDLTTVTGKSYNAKDIKDAVSFASKATGVPKGFLVGVLKMETNLGANVGGCTYAQVESGAEANYKKGKLSKRAWNTFQTRRATFKGICDALDYNYKKQKVSCNPSGYAGTGGAMGVAQFMPDTWNGYKSQVASKTGHNPPDPWNLTDGVMAMALKLGKTPGVTSGSKSAMKSAACSYLGTCYAPYINGILYWADNYKSLI